MPPSFSIAKIPPSFPVARKRRRQFRTHPAMHLPLDAIAPLAGFLGSGIAALGLWFVKNVPIAQAIPDPVKSWLEGGAYVALVGCLSYAVVTLWRRLNQRDKDIADLNAEIREDWKGQNKELIDVLRKLDPDNK